MDESIKQAKRKKEISGSRLSPEKKKKKEKRKQKGFREKSLGYKKELEEKKLFALMDIGKWWL